MEEVASTNENTNSNNEGNSAVDGVEGLNMYFVKGDFHSSFSIQQIQNFEEKNLILSDISFTGSKTIRNAEAITEIPQSFNENLYFKKNNLLEKVEIYPISNQAPPLEEAKRMMVLEMLVLSPTISAEQEINGVTHGNISGTAYCKIAKIKEVLALKKEEVKTKDDLPPVLPLEKNSISPSQQMANAAFIDEPTVDLTKRSGCSPLAMFSMRGCLSWLLLLLLLLGLFLLLRNCQKDKVQHDNEEPKNSKNERRFKEREEKLEKSNKDAVEKEQKKDKTNYETIKELKTISLPNVQFYTNSAKLLPGSQKELNELAIYLLENEQMNATILGHTDNVGDDDKNLILSQNRAEAVKDFLVKLGVNSERIEAIGKGETEPRESNESIEGRLMNRRVEVKLEGKKVIENNIKN